MNTANTAISDLLNMGAAPAADPKPEKSGFSKEGYFDWENTKHVAQKNVAVGVIMPPYADWFTERVVAAKSGKPFTTPFMLAHGLHAVGLGQKGKVYCECRRTLVRENKVGNDFPLLSPEIVAGGEECPICAICWDQIWPKVQSYDSNKDSPEYKAWKGAHKAATPQLKHLINFLPMNGEKPLIFDLAKTVSEKLAAIHYDAMQPDLLWPFTKPGAWMSTWVKIERLPQMDGTPTKYDVQTCYQGFPQVMDAERKFNQDAYLALLKALPDLRVEAKKCLPRDQETVNKAVSTLVALAPNRLQTTQAVISRVSEAASSGNPNPSFAGVPPTAASVPASTLPPAPPVAAAASAPVTPVAPTMGLPPALPSATAAPAPAGLPSAPPIAPTTGTTTVAPAAGGTSVKTSQDAIDLLSSLLDPTKK